MSAQKLSSSSLGAELCPAPPLAGGVLLPAPNLLPVGQAQAESVEAWASCRPLFCNHLFPVYGEEALRAVDTELGLLWPSQRAHPGPGWTAEAIEVQQGNKGEYSTRASSPWEQFRPKRKLHREEVSGQLSAQGLWPVVEGTCPPRGSTGAIKPQLVLFLPPVSLWGFLLGG